MDRETTRRLVGFINSHGAILKALINKLDESGAISRSAFSEQLGTLANTLEREWQDDPDVWDLHLIRSLAGELKPDNPYPDAVLVGVPDVIRAQND